MKKVGQAKLDAIVNQAFEACRDERFDDGEQYFLQARQVAQSLFGEADRKTIRIDQYLAHIYHAQERNQEAEALLKKIIPLLREIDLKKYCDVDQSGADILEALQLLGEICVDAERWDEAKEIYLDFKAIAIYRYYDPDHDHFTIATEALLMISVQQENTEEAALHCKELVEIKEIDLGSDAPDTIASMRHLAALYIDLERYEEAEALLLKLKGISQDMHDADAPETIEISTAIWDMHAYRILRQTDPRYINAMMLQEEVRERLQYDEMFDEDEEDDETDEDEDEAPKRLSGYDRLYQIVDVYCLVREFDQALVLCEEIKDIAARVDGQENVNTVNAWYSIGNLFSLQERYKEAEPYYLHVREVLERRLGVDHPETLECYIKLADVYFFQGRLEEAETLRLHVENFFPQTNEGEE